MTSQNHAWRPPGLTIAVMLLVVLLSAWGLNASLETAQWLGAEEGPVETASSFVLGLALIVTLLQLKHRFSLPWMAGAVMLLWMFLREMDMQKRFTYRSVESLGYYTSSRAPWTEKMLVLLILIPFGLAGLKLLWLFLRNLRPAIRRREPWLINLGAGIGLGAAASVSEKIFSGGVVEETCELGLALLVLLLTWEFRSQSRAAAPPADTVPSNPAGESTPPAAA